MAPQKIVLVGPESCGKTTLVFHLATYFQATFVLEYAREYLNSGNTVQSPEDLVHIAKNQLNRELLASQNCPNPWLFCDTDIHNLVVWSQYVFGFVDPKLQVMEEEQHYDLYLLLSPDIPWIEDGIRQSPQLREELYAIYRARLAHKNRRFVEISGTENRLMSCLKAVAHFSQGVTALALS